MAGAGGCGKRPTSTGSQGNGAKTDEASPGPVVVQKSARGGARDAFPATTTLVGDGEAEASGGRRATEKKGQGGDADGHQRRGRDGDEALEWQRHGEGDGRCWGGVDEVMPRRGTEARRGDNGRRSGRRRRGRRGHGAQRQREGSGASVAPRSRSVRGGGGRSEGSGVSSPIQIGSGGGEGVGG